MTSPYEGFICGFVYLALFCLIYLFHHRGLRGPERPRKTDRVPDGGTEQHRAAVGPHKEAEQGVTGADRPESEFILTSTSAAVKIAARPLG